MLSPILFTKTTKCKSPFSLLNIGDNTCLLSQGLWHVLPAICAEWHTNNLFSYIPSQCHGMPPTLRNARHISQISENARHIFQNIKYIIPVVYFASHLILCCWHTNHLLLYPWNLRRKPFGFLESADCKN